LTATNGNLVDNNDGTYSFTPTANFNGTVNFGYNVIDGNGGSVAATQSITIAPANDAPVVSNAIAPQFALEDTPFTFTLPSDTFIEPDGDSLSYIATSANGSDLPSWLTFDANTLTFSGSPPQDADMPSVTVTASDG
ncbi:MAG TPA: cadherin-like domain-containing protein, partial [Candidatus Obscuribacterales bacterium]